MPVYCYRCNDCKEEFEVRHSMTFDGQRCVTCDSGSIFRIPSLAKIKKHFVTKKVGKIVNEYIEEVKEEIKNEKTKLKSEEL